MLTRLAVFISGSGTNLQAILDAVASGGLPAEIVLVVSNRKDAYGLVRAAEAGVETLYFPLKPYKDDGRGRAAYDAELAEIVAAYRPDWIVLAGWMHVLSSAFLDRFPGRVLNLHPALPGQFAGTQAIERAFAAYQRGEISESGCMVHLVVPEVDAGPVIAQAVVPFEAGETLAQYERRIHAAEHRLMVAAIHKVIAL
jgi:formyltetrahydrofolate-dependent phosphoribosylglycinamide formyltransferase